MRPIFEAEQSKTPRLSAKRTAALLDVDREHGGISGDVREPTPKNPLLIEKLHAVVERIPGYGYKKVAEHLSLQENEKYNHKMIYQIMKREGLVHKRKKSFVVPRTTQSNHKWPISPNLSAKLELNRLDQLWVGDITYVRLKSGQFVYLAVILDAFSRQCIGYALANHMRTELTLDALEMAVDRRKLKGKCKSELIFHSDRGSQYASSEYRAKLAEYGIQSSMSGKGNCYDNAKAESFNRTLKVEDVYLNEYHSVVDARTRIYRYIEDIYNKERLHSSLGMLSPAQFEQNLLVEQGVA